MSFDKPLAWILAVALCSSLVPTAGAQTYEQLEKMCFAKGSSGDQAIRGCSAIITGGRRSGTYLGAAYGGRGFAYLNRGDSARALPDLNQAIRLNPNDFASLNNRGRIYLNQDKLDQALSDFTASLRIKPDYFRALINRGGVYQMQGDTQRAIADYDRAIRNNPSFANAYTQRAYGYLVLGQPEQALADCNESQRLEPNAQYMLEMCGAANLRLNHLDAAITFFDADLRARPRTAWSLYGRGVAKRRKGDVAGGDADIAAARALSSTITAGMAHIGIRP